jgi:GntR family transcriptional regulator/MocR family aminotransferase
MTKRTSSFELALPERSPGVSAQNWLYSALRADIVEGRLRPGTRLPATRELAMHYALSRGTIVNAFDQLKAEGYLEGTVGSGTYISKVLPDELLEVARSTAAKSRIARKPERILSDYARHVTPFPNFEFRPGHAFMANLPALDLFPAALWAQVAARRLRRVSRTLLLGCPPMGYKPLRQAVAAYLGTSRGVRCVPEQVAIVSGVQEALDLTARLLLNPGDRVCMEDPGYPGAAAVFKAVGARLSTLPVDNEGMTLDRPSLRGARLVYVTPGHQFPLGITMSLPRRLQLLDWAARSGALILEDDYDGEYRYVGRPVPALQGLDRRELVLFTGSFSKVLFPSLRLGYLVVPAGLIERLSATLSITSRHAPLLEQAVLCDFIAEGHFGRHLRRMRQVYAERLSVLQESARERLAGLIEFIGIEAGLQTAAWLCDGLTGETAAAAAAVRKVEVIPLSLYSLGKPAREGLQIGFAAIDTKEIRRGVADLAIALEGALKTPRDSRRRTPVRVSHSVDRSTIQGHGKANAAAFASARHPAKSDS